MRRRKQQGTKDPGRGESPLEGVIFDLDGVLVTTDRFHFLAWKELADELGLEFDENVNHHLRGVSRQQSLRNIYEHNKRRCPDEATFQQQCHRKNARYVELVKAMTGRDVLTGAVQLLQALREAHLRLAVASASKNTPLVLERTGLGGYFDAIADGNDVARSKPDPEGFLLAARRLGVPAANCIGVEDAASGIEAIHNAGMVAVGVGRQAAGADCIVGSVAELTVESLRRVHAAGRKKRVHGLH